MLERTLQRIVDQEWTNAKEIAEVTGSSPSTVYRWISGQSQPDFSQVRLMIHGLCEPQAQQAILSALTMGSQWQTMHMSPELDVNRDGKVDHDDALDATCSAIKSTSGSLMAIRAATRGHKMSADQVLEVIGMLDQTIKHCVTTQRIMVEVAERRKKARTPRLKLSDPA